MGSPPPRVARDKNIPDLVPTDTSDSDDEGDKNESNRLVIVCPRPITAPLMAQATPLPPIPDYRNYITQDENISPPACNTRSQSTIFSIMYEAMLSCLQMSRISYQIDPRKAASRKYPLIMFCKMEGAVLDEETGDLLEYRHLFKHPNPKKVWGGAFGK